MILAGVALALWLLDNRPNRTVGVRSAAGESGAVVGATEPVVISDPLLVAAAPLPEDLRHVLSQTVTTHPALQLVTTAAPSSTLQLDWNAADGTPIYKATFAAATRFDTVFPTTTLTTVQEAWQGESEEFSAVAVLSDTIPALEQLLGSRGTSVTGFALVDEVADAAYARQAVLVLLPFDQLVPKLVALAVDGQNPVENANRFDPAAYPLVATLYLHRLHEITPDQEPVEAALLAAIPPGNRDPNRLTVIAITGVTAMTRLTAQQMDKFGPAWPAEVIGPELALADITHISNEVPFVEGCETDIRTDNFNFCSKPEYLAALTAVGVDIIGLTGNHQNDFGRENALKSLEFYADAGLPVYGGGRNEAEAHAPLFLEHNGNRLAFLGANSYGPALAWATADKPGSARLDVARMSATIRSIRAEDRADVILAELQYHERYDVTPFIEQRIDFNALSKAGADIVTGVQSHVPQALEFTDGKLILYGLGNLFFDQMASMPVREGIIAKHTIYKGRHISTQLLTTVIYDYGQPRWATPEQRSNILRRVFTASYWEN
jgi:poly-gamma-glutamate synthesis protein (capsule biosynthesis protein)